MRLAGLKESGLCCEIMDNDGQMMKTSQLIEFAIKHDMKFITIKSLQEYRKKHDKLVNLVASPVIPTEFGDFRAYGYENVLNKEHHIALVKGDISNGEDVLVRVHSECLTGDVFHSLKCDCGKQLKEAMKQIQNEQRGILLYMRQEGRGIGLLNKLKAYELQQQGMNTIESNLILGFKEDERQYYIGCQILKDLGVKSINLMTNNPDKVDQVNEYGIQIKNRVPIEIKCGVHDRNYQQTKQEQMGHYLNVK